MIEISNLDPTLEQSNKLLKHFFGCVNPFTRIVHTAHFGRLLNQHRRGASKFPKETRALLFSIYALTINSMPSDTFEANFHIPKSAWLDHFQVGAQEALLQVDFCKSNNVFTLMALLHYLVLSLILFQQI